jgi:putative tryptophan/tyrosine transport system substrate-binding protein
MIIKKYVIAGSLIIVLAASFAVLKRKSSNESHQGTITIGILQTASHPALDAVREGFVHELTAHLPRAKFIVQNAQGVVSHAHAIAQSFHDDKSITAIFTIATPALQAMASIEKQKPIFFAAVTDPRSVGVVHAASNATGDSDMINVPDTIAMIKALLPSAKTVALIYNSAEINSTILVQSMKKELEKAGLIALDFGVTCEADIPPVLHTALSKADVLLAPTDNTVASTIDLIAKQALQAKKPFMVSDNLLVSKGALAARGVDYNVSGIQAAQRVVAVLKNGKQPSTLPIAYATSGNIFINKDTACVLGIKIPAELEDQVTFVDNQ